MKQKSLVHILTSALLCYGAAAAAGSGMWLPEQQMKDYSIARHVTGENRAYPSDYAGLRNPLDNDEAVVKSGERIFKEHCVACHGELGLGDGPAGAKLSPTPANLMLHLKRSYASDGYLFWTISNGGKQFETAMPAFETVLAPEERWQVIRYVKQLSF